MTLIGREIFLKKMEELQIMFRLVFLFQWKIMSHIISQSSIFQGTFYVTFYFFIYLRTHVYICPLVEEWSVTWVFPCVFVLSMTADRHSSHADPRRDNYLPVSLSFATSPLLLLRCRKTSRCRQAALIVRWKCVILKLSIINAISYFNFLSSASSGYHL